MQRYLCSNTSLGCVRDDKRIIIPATKEDHAPHRSCGLPATDTQAAKRANGDELSDLIGRIRGDVRTAGKICNREIAKIPPVQPDRCDGRTDPMVIQELRETARNNRMANYS